MVKLFCAVNKGIVVEVDIDKSLPGEESEAWLTEGEVKKGDSDTAGLKLLEAARAEIGVVGLSEDAVRVEVTEGEVSALKGPVNALAITGDDVASRVPSAPPTATAIVRPPERLKRWAAINEMIRQKNLAGNEKTSSQDTTRKRRDPDSYVSYSSLTWAEVEPSLPLEQFVYKAKPVPDEVVTQILARLEQLRKLYGDVLTGDKRKIFIAAVLEAVCLLVGDVTILVQEEVKGKNVHVHGQFEYVLMRGTKRISIVEAKRDGIEQGMAQIVTGLEALADVAGIDQTLGIVTSFLSWVFFSDCDKSIQRVDQLLNGTIP